VSGSAHAEGRFYPDIDDVFELYAGLFGCTQSQAADQLRNRSGLEGALARPQSYAHYQDADVALQAAVLAHGIAEGQHFIDGNKRTALAAMLTFLRANGYDVDASQEERAAWILQLSVGTTAEELAELLRIALKPRE
jgi:death-on-curing protein